LGGKGGEGRNRINFCLSYYGGGGGWKRGFLKKNLFLGGRIFKDSLGDGREGGRDSSLFLVVFIFKRVERFSPLKGKGRGRWRRPSSTWGKKEKKGEKDPSLKGCWCFAPGRKTNGERKKGSNPFPRGEGFDKQSPREEKQSMLVGGSTHKSHQRSSFLRRKRTFIERKFPEGGCLLLRKKRGKGFNEGRGGVGAGKGRILKGGRGGPKIESTGKGKGKVRFPRGGKKGGKGKEEKKASRVRRGGAKPGGGGKI